MNKASGARCGSPEAMGWSDAIVIMWSPRSCWRGNACYCIKMYVMRMGTVSKRRTPVHKDRRVLDSISPTPDKWILHYYQPICNNVKHSDTYRNVPISLLKLLISPTSIKKTNIESWCIKALDTIWYDRVEREDVGSGYNHPRHLRLEGVPKAGKATITASRHTERSLTLRVRIVFWDFSGPKHFHPKASRDTPKHPLP